ncbi:MAG: hypothetical protein M3383_10315 [Actinomycetota bacterium]|nr:hypothetical protein [Actinomycetota bacterium]
MSAEPQDLHLADLYARAARAGIEGYRLLRREDLVERLGGASSDEGDASPRRRRGRRGGRGRGGSAQGTGSVAATGSGRERLPRHGDRADEPVETVEVTGTLELTRQRHGFLRVPGSDDDVYVSASQVRRCELKDGDEVTGPARQPRQGERHRALVRVNLVNGEDPVDPVDARRQPKAAPKQSKFDSLTPESPTRRVSLPAGADPLVRAADLLAPLAFGQRVLVRAAPRSGRTTLLRGLARAIEALDDVELTVLLIDERPEEAPAWSEAVPDSDLALAPADLSPAEQARVATDALERARAHAEGGADAVLLCDSLTRLAVAAGGVDEVKRLFGSGRALAGEGAGTLTVVATTLAAADDEGSAERAVATTETSVVSLDPTLAEEGITPALRFAECRAVGDDRLLPEAELDGLRHLRATLRDQTPPDAATFMREKLDEFPANSELLSSLA